MEAKTLNKRKIVSEKFGENELMTIFALVKDKVIKQQNGSSRS